MNIEEINFSVDDVILILKWIKENNPNSIFDMEFFKALRYWNKRYGLRVSLYIYETCNGFSLEELPEQYWEEFKKNTSWLKFSWHQISPDPIPHDPIEQIKSFDRVKKIICSKISEEAWTDTIRLHKGQADKTLLNHIKNSGKIQCLLCNDINVPSYDLVESDIKDLNKHGILDKNGVKYKKMDICLDFLSNEDEQASLLVKKVDKLIASREIKNLAIFFHERQFAKIQSKVYAFLDELFRENTQELFLNSAVRVREWLYFTACNSSCLFRMNLDNKKIEVVQFLYGCDSRGMKFSGLYYYKGRIWMIPWTEKKIYIYYIDESRTEVLTLPEEMNIDAQYNGFRKSIVQDKYLWLLPCRYQGIIRIDMEEVSYKIYDNWPPNTSFDLTKKMNFKMMFLYKEDLYLLNDGCSISLKLRAESKEFIEWKEGRDQLFGTMDHDKFFVAPVHDRIPLKIIKPYENAREIPLPDKVWVEEHYYEYSYWYSEQADDKILFLPHEATGLIIMDSFTESISIVDFDLNGYKTLRPNKNYAIYHVEDYRNDYLMLPYQGNKMFLVSKEGKVEREYFITIEREYCTQHFSEEEIALRQYLWAVNNINITPVNWRGKTYEKQQFDIGEGIHQIIKEQV